MPVTIRRATPDDAATVVEFNLRLATESEGKTLDPKTVATGVASGLADTNRALYFVAELDGQIVGQTMITFEWSDWRNGWVWWIQSVYVRAEARRRGVFRSLYTHIHDLARQDPNVVAIRLYVEDRNRAAQDTYRDLGMMPAGYFVLEKYPL